MKKIIKNLLIVLIITICSIGVVKLNAASVVVSMNDGASIRTEEPNGLKFSAKVTNWSPGMTMGMVIGRGELQLSQLTVNNLEAAVTIVDELDSDNCFHISMVNIPEYAYSQKMTARAFVKSGESYIYSENTVTRSIVDVAVEAYKDGNTNTIISNLNEYNKKKTVFNLNGGSFVSEYQFTLTKHNTGGSNGLDLTLTDAGKETGFGNFWDRLVVKYIPTVGAYKVVKVIKSGKVFSENIGDTSYDFIIGAHVKATDQEGYNKIIEIVNSSDPTQYFLQFEAEQISGSGECNIEVKASKYYEMFMGNILHLNNGDVLPSVEKPNVEFLGWYDNPDFTGDAVTVKTSETNIYAKWSDDSYTVNYELSDGSWSWTTGTVSDASGIDSISTLPEVFMADFYQYLSENNLLNSGKVAASLRVNNWADFKTPYGDPVALYNATSTGIATAADGYSELFFDSVSGTEVFGGFLGSSPYKEKYAYVTSHIIQMLNVRYTVTPTDSNYKGCFGFILDGYFYGTQGLLSSTKTGYETYNYLRSVVPTPTTGYNGTEIVHHEYQIDTALKGTSITLVEPVKVGHMFLGWYLNSDFTGNPVASVSNGCTLYAKWYDLNAPAPVHNINYVLNDSPTAPATHADGYPTTFTQGEGVKLLNPKRPGYAFLGWSLDENGKNKITSIPATAVAQVTVYANWLEISGEGYTISYVYTEGELASTRVSTFDEFTSYFWNEYYQWTGSNIGIEAFKTEVLAAWSTGADSQYPLYNMNYDETTIDENYFIHSSSKHDVWMSWFLRLDDIMININDAQSVWTSAYTTRIRLSEFLTNAEKSYWTADRKEALWTTFNIPSEFIYSYQYGDEFDLPKLKVADGRSFLGWYDESGNKVTSITSTMVGDFVLTARFSTFAEIDDFIDGLFVTDSFVEPENTISITAKAVKNPELKISWESLNPSIAIVDEFGTVTGIKAGYAEIRAYIDGSTVNLTFGVTVISLEESAFFKYLAEAHNEEIFVIRNLDVAYSTYYTDVIGSVSNYLYNKPYTVDKSYYFNPNKTLMTSVEFITVHYNGMPQASVGGGRTALSLYNQYKAGTNNASWHYSTGNDGIFQSMPDNQRAGHAGDGSREVNWANSGVKATSNTKPTYGRSGGYLTINGTKSKIALPSGYTSTRFTWFGPAWKVQNGYYYIAGLYYNSTYKYICNGGGNRNSVGIESACNEGSDLWYTYHITAQLVAQLLDKYNLDTTRVYGHHAFSGKDCPQTLLENNGDPWYKFMDLIEAELNMVQNMSGYTISMTSNNPDIVDNHGRVVKIPTETTTVSYKVTVKNNSTGVSKTATFSSIVHGSATE